MKFDWLEAGDVGMLLEGGISLSEEARQGLGVLLPSLVSPFGEGLRAVRRWVSDRLWLAVALLVLKVVMALPGKLVLLGWVGLEAASALAGHYL
jgi:hypothetical protein